MMNKVIPEETKRDLYGVLFHYSYHREKWACFNSGEKAQYFNGETEYIGFGKSIEEAYDSYTATLEKV